MTVTHDACRLALAGGSGTADVQSHLAGCADCRAFQTALGRIDELLEEGDLLQPPPDLADRIVSRLEGDHRSGALLPFGSSLRSKTIRAAIAAAVAALLVAAGLAVSSDRRDGPELALISAAETIESDRTMSVTMTGDIELSVKRDGRAPDFSPLPDEVQSYFESRWEEMMARFEAQVDRALEAGDRMIDDAIGQIEDGLRTPRRSPRSTGDETDGADAGERANPASPAPPGGTAYQPPDRLFLGFAVTASGTVDVDGRMELDGTLTPVSGSVAAPQSQAAFGVVVAGQVSAVRQPGGGLAPLARQPTGSPLGSLLTQPGAIPRMLRDARQVEHRGQARIDGADLEHYTFDADGHRADAYLGADHRLRRLTIADSGGQDQFGWRSTVSIHVAGYGVDARSVGQGAHNSEGEAVHASGRSAILYPLGPAVAGALKEGGR